MERSDRGILRLGGATHTDLYVCPSVAHPVNTRKRPGKAKKVCRLPAHTRARARAHAMQVAG